MTPDVLLRSWANTLSNNAARPAIYDTRGEVLRTFGDIAAEVCRLQDGELGGIAPGSVVAIQIGNHPAWPALLLACLELRLVALPLERSIGEHERDAALQTCQATAIAIAPDRSEQLALSHLKFNPIDWRDRQPVLLKLTSGTTAAPRAIRFQSHQLLADCGQICDTMGVTERDLNFAVIPLSHSYGFSNIVTPLIARGVPMALSNDRMPRAVLDDLARTGATVFPGMPVFYQAFCGMSDAPELPKLRLCISAGAPLPLPVAQQFRDKFGHAIHSFYGSSECGGICYDREAPLIEQGFVGEPMSGVTLEPLGVEMDATQVRVHSAAAGDGYFPEPDEAKLGNGSFVPDDLLTRTFAGDTPASTAEEASGFRIVGRLSDVINVAGKKVNPAEVEATLLCFPGVREAVVFGLRSTLRNEEVAACVVAQESVQERELLAHCRLRLSGWQVPKRLFFVAAMAVGERGKISRRALSEQFQPGALS